MDKYIRVKNCNCISDATIEIVEKSLNIKYGSNGTGKSTISEAIYAQANNETDRLKDFKPYGSNDNSQPTVDNPYFHVVKVFNEDYVNSYLFQGDEFLDDSFQVFLKSDKCDSLAAQIEKIYLYQLVLVQVKQSVFFGQLLHVKLKRLWIGLKILALRSESET